MFLCTCSILQYLLAYLYACFYIALRSCMHGILTISLMLTPCKLARAVQWYIHLYLNHITTSIDKLIIVQADSVLALGEGLECGIGRLQEYHHCNKACQVHLQQETHHSSQQLVENAQHDVAVRYLCD